MLAIKSKLAISRLTVITAGLIILILNIGIFGTAKYASLASVLFTIAVFLAGFLVVTFSDNSFISAAPAMSLAMIYILAWPQALIGSVFAIVCLGLVKNRVFNFQRIIQDVSKESLNIFFAYSVFILTGGKPITLWSSLELNSNLWLTKLFLPAIFAAIVYFILSTAIEQMFYAFSKGVSFTPVFIGSFRTQAPVFFTFGTISLLMAFMYQGMQFWSIILFSVPLVVSGHSFKLNLNIRKAYQDTITALVNTIEAQNQSHRGHAERVADYCVDIARELGLYGKQLENVNYAALLHDIGNLGFEPGTKAEEVFNNTEDEHITKGIPLHALVGADILGQVDFLKSVSSLVKFHHYPFQDVIKTRSEKGKFPIGARIIQVATDFDKMVSNRNEDERLDFKLALKKIKNDQGYIYDPRVIRAFKRVLKKQGKLK
jgi:hypothetical protein